MLKKYYNDAILIIILLYLKFGKQLDLSYKDAAVSKPLTHEIYNE